MISLKPVAVRREIECRNRIIKREIKSDNYIFWKEYFLIIIIFLKVF